jgi:hypothetical protein
LKIKEAVIPKYRIAFIIKMGHTMVQLFSTKRIMLKVGHRHRLK